MVDSSDAAAPGLAPGSAVAFLAGGGELGERMRAHDWSGTPLGAPEHWPHSLKTAVRIMLTSRQPIFIGWGEELIYLYNDAYRPIVGGKHPASLGQPLSAVWKELWSDIEPMLSTAMSGDEGTYVEEQLLIMERHGYPEETYYTFSYSPIPADASLGGRAGGIICANSDDTRRVIGERQVSLLGEVAASGSNARSWQDAGARAAQALGGNPRDILFAGIYVTEQGAEGEFTRVGLCGAGLDHPLLPARLYQDSRLWPVSAAMETAQPQHVRDLDERGARPIPTGAWQKPAREAVLLPIGEAERRPGLLIVGLNPYRLYDESYARFLELLAGQISSNMTSAAAYDEERRRAEALAELDRAKTQFFSNVSHEFRTPLALMLGPLEDVLQQQSLAPHIRKQLGMVQRNGRRLQKLVNTLLDFSRIEAGHAQPRFVPADLASFTSALASNFESACDRAGLTLQVRCDPMPHPVLVDRDMWEKVVLNLVSNAFKFTLEGSIDVRLSARGKHAELEVRDTGTGIPAEALPRLFERFHRVEGARGRSAEGSGIGLALVRELVTLHGGDVWAESKLDQGTTFHVRLPLEQPGASAHAEVTAAPDAAPTKGRTAGSYVEEALRWLPADSEPTTAPDAPALPSSLPPLAPPQERAAARVLLAEDNADMRDYVSDLLRAAHYAVTAVGDGQAALDSARNAPPDIVLSDVMMPHLDGFGLLKALRAEPSTRALPVILLSARAGEDERIGGAQAGADAYISKPFSARELIARVDAHVALARTRREAQQSLEESEARFRTMADNAPVMIWMTDSDGQCLYLNRKWYDFTGTEPPAGLGLGWLDSIHPDDKTAAEDQFLEGNRKGRPLRIEYRCRRHDGEYHWVIDSAAPRYGAGDEFLGYIGSVIDITELKRVEDALREADRRKDEFLATLAHELRNPLAPIRTGLELMREAPDDAEMNARVLDTMERQTKQLIVLVDDLMDVSRITRGRLELRKSRVTLKDVLDSAVEASRPLLDEGGHSLTIRPWPQPVLLDADPHRLAQVISNLLNNAAKYTPDGGRVEIDVQPLAGEVAIRVKDSGIGISKPNLQRVFDMFTQIDSPHTSLNAGLGIGLTLVKSLVDMHGGSVEVHSDGEHQGSEFVVRLPVLEARAEADASTEPQAAKRSSGHKPRILVVDDNVEAAEMLSLMVARLGNDVRTAHDGRQAVELAEAFRPDVVLMDLGMPVMNGYDAAQRMRAASWGADITLVALSGWGQDEHKRKAREAGFDHHLVKPAEPAVLRKLLEQRTAD